MTTEEQESVAGAHKSKIKPPTFNGDYGTFEECKPKFQAHMGSQHGEHARLMTQAEQLNKQCSTPVATRSMGYLTKLLKPTLDQNNFEESFSHWEFDLSCFERDNTTTLPDQVKEATLLNETTGPLQQHLQLLAGTNKTYKQSRPSWNITKRPQLQAVQHPVGTRNTGGSAPMDIGVVGEKKLQRKRLRKRKRLRIYRKRRQRTTKWIQRNGRRKGQFEGSQ